MAAEPPESSCAETLPEIAVDLMVDTSSASTRTLLPVAERMMAPLDI